MKEQLYICDRKKRKMVIPIRIITIRDHCNNYFLFGFPMHPTITKSCICAEYTDTLVIIMVLSIPKALVMKNPPGRLFMINILGTTYNRPPRSQT